MIYLINGKQNIRLKSQMKSIIKDSIKEIDAMNFVKFDASLTQIQEIMSEANYMPLGYDKKVVVIDSPYFLMKERTKSKIESEQDYQTLLNYLNQPNPDVDLIFLVNTAEKEIDKKNEYYQLIEKNGKVITVAEPKQEQWNDVVKQYFTSKWPDTVIDSDAVVELGRRTEGDYASLFNNGSKLALYTDHITFNDVTKMVTRPLEENSFLLFNYLVDEKNMEAVSLFRDLKTSNVEPVTLISMVANQFRLLNRVSYLARHNYAPDDIAKELNINPIRAKILRKNSFVVSGKRVLQTLEDLYQLDKQIKSGLVDRYYSFELFLINFKRK